MKTKIFSKTLRLTILLVSFMGMHFIAKAQNEGNFYTETIGRYSGQINLVTSSDYNVNGNGRNTDSAELQKAIDDVNKDGGGVIYLPRGTYRLAEIKLRSNVHIKIQAGSTIDCFVNGRGGTQALTVFSLGGTFDGGRVQNVSIRGVGGKYNIRTYNTAKGTSAFGLADVRNFLISDFICNDAFSKFSSMNFGITIRKEGNVQIPIPGTRPLNGLVKNCKSINARYGYGFVQLQAGENIFFKNIDGDGGCTLRCETGWVAMNDAQIGGIKKIYGRNIIGRNGKCAVMISPHSMNNGLVSITDVKSYSCSYAATIDGGYVAKRQTNPDLKPGKFSKVVVKNIKAEFGATAQIKAKDRNWIPLYRNNLLTETSEDFGESVIGPAIAAVRFDDHNYKGNVQVSNITACGFGCQTDIVNQDDKKNTLDCANPDYSAGCINGNGGGNNNGGGNTSGGNNNSGAPIGSYIWLKATNGNYVSAIKNGTNAPVLSNKTRLGSWEKFQVVNAGGGLIALKANANSKYISMRNNLNDKPLQARANTIGNWEKFTWESLGGNAVAFKANVNNKYVWCQKNVTNGPLRAKGSGTGGWARFTYGTTTANKSSNTKETEDLVSGIKVYPLPMGNTLTIASNSKVTKVNIYDTLGRIVLEKTDDTISSVNVSTLTKGIYIMEVFTSNGRWTKKVLK